MNFKFHPSAKLRAGISNFKYPWSPRSRISCLKMVCAVTVLMAVFSGCSDRQVAESPRPFVEKRQAPPARIVSLAPSITEILFDLGLGKRVVGVTRYCDYPPEAQEKARVGGYFDVNYEAVLGQEPDLVILLEEHQDARDRLDELGLDTLAVNHSRVEGILRSITTIGDRCGAKENGESLRLSLENRIHRIQEHFFAQSFSRPAARPKPRVLVAVGRLMDKGAGGEIYISGRDGIYDDLITLAGGVNAYRDETLKFPAISDEGLIRIDPDLIIEMVPDLASEADRESLLGLWRRKTAVRAVREGRVHILGEDYAVVPGPRFIHLLDDMAKILNVEG